MSKNLYVDWLRDGLNQKGKTHAGLAELLGVHPSIIGKILAGKRRMLAEEVPLIADYINKPVPGITPTASQIVATEAGVKIMGEIQSGVFIERGAGGRHPEDLAPIIDPRYPARKQFAFKLAESLPEQFLKAGCYLNAVPFSDFRKAPLEGDLIITKTAKNNLISYGLVTCQNGDLKPLVGSVGGENYALVIGDQNIRK
jgi:DNA-binding transcriptional regulator YdaS (Cro superfamily)